MGITLGSNFDLGASLPLDSRTVVADLTALNALTAIYKGMLVYVDSEDTYYKYDGSAWSEYSSGGGISPWEASTDYDNGQIVTYQNKIYASRSIFTSGATFDEDNWYVIGEASKSLSTFYAENFDRGVTGSSNFTCLDGGTIGLGSVITSFVSQEIVEPLDGKTSIKFTIPSSGTGKYALLNSSHAISVPRYAQNGKSSFTFVADGTADYGDISLFLWDTTNAETIKDKDGNTLFINPRANIGNTLYFNTNGTEALQWGAFINRDNTGATLVIDNVEIQGNPDKNISVYASSDAVIEEGIDIGGTVTSPTKGTTSTDKIVWAQNGKYLDASYQYRQFVGGAAGSGTYVLKLPNSLEADTTLVDLNAGAGQDSGNATPIGDFYASTGGTGVHATGKVFMYSSDRFLLQLGASNTNNGASDSSSGNVIGSASFNLGSPELIYKINIRIPIKGWSDKEDNVIVAGTNDDALDRKKFYRDASVVSTSNGAWTNIVLNTEDSRNVGGLVSYDTFLGNLTVSKSDWYDIDLSSYFNTPTASNKNIRLRNVTDGLDLIYKEDYATQGNVKVSETVFLQTGKNYQFQAFQDAGGPVPISGGKALTFLNINHNPSYKETILMYLQESNNRTSDGREYMTTESIDGKPVYERVWKVASDVTSTTLGYDTIDTNLNIVNGVNVGSGAFVFDNQYIISGSDRLMFRYVQSTGNIDILLDARTAYTGQVFKIRYTKP